jgi:hypothetical protein
MEPIESSETSAFKTQTPGKYPKENILHKEHGESLKSRNYTLFTELHKFESVCKQLDISRCDTGSLPSIIALIGDPERIAFFLFPSTNVMSIVFRTPSSAFLKTTLLHCTGHSVNDIRGGSRCFLFVCKIMLVP